MPVSQSIKAILVSHMKTFRVQGLNFYFQEYVESNQKFDNLAQTNKDKNEKDKRVYDPFRDHNSKYKGVFCPIS